ncbi:MAG: type III pantothenate kinase [bacterium]|nr:type III pantothenate kinase [bacterium]
MKTDTTKIFCVDIGNSSVDGGVYSAGRILNRKKSLLKDINKFISFAAKIILKNGIEKVSVSTVVPEAGLILKKALSDLPCKVYFVNPSEIKTVEINDKYKKQAGADRIANAAAASMKYKTPVLVVDFGTAITFDVVKKPGHYDGSIIFPGLRTSKNALISSAALLPEFNFAKTRSVIADNTPDAVRAGLYYGITELVRGMKRRIEKELGIRFRTVIGTGGDAGIFKEENLFDVIDGDLTLFGAAVLMIDEDNYER